MDIPEPHIYITKYEVSCLPIEHPSASAFTINVEYRGNGRWAIEHHTACLGIDGEWSYGYSWRDGKQEPSTDEEFAEHNQGFDEWLAAHRFDKQTALQLAREYAPKINISGWTVEKILAAEKDD